MLLLTDVNFEQSTTESLQLLRAHLRQRRTEATESAQDARHQARIQRVLPQSHPHSKLPDTQLHRLPQDPQKTRQGTALHIPEKTSSNIGCSSVFLTAFPHIFWCNLARGERRSGAVLHQQAC